MSGAALEAVGLAVTLGGRVLLHDARFSLPAGRLVAIVGPNGAGKTTLLKALAGLIPATGAVRLRGAPLASLPRRERARRIAFLPQGHQLGWPLAVRDVVALGRYPHGVADPARMRPEDAAIVAGAMVRTATSALAERNALSLSGGERARVMLARVLAVGAPVLLADEPTAALDPRHQVLLMRELAAETARGTLVIAVTHDLMLAARFADDVMLMDEGRIVALGPAQAVLTPANIRRIYGMTAHVDQVAGEALVVPWDVAGDAGAPMPR